MFKGWNSWQGWYWCPWRVTEKAGAVRQQIPIQTIRQHWAELQGNLQSENKMQTDNDLTRHWCTGPETANHCVVPHPKTHCICAMIPAGCCCYGSEGGIREDFCKEDQSPMGIRRQFGKMQHWYQNRFFFFLLGTLWGHLCTLANCTSVFWKVLWFSIPRCSGLCRSFPIYSSCMVIIQGIIENLKYQ